MKNIQEFLKGLFSKIDPNDSSRIITVKFLLFIAILTVPTGFASVVTSFDVTENRKQFPYADVDRFSPEADSLRMEYRALHNDIQECALIGLSNGTYTPSDYVYDVYTTRRLEEMYCNVSLGTSSLEFSSSLAVSHPDFFNGRNPRSGDFGKAVDEIERAHTKGHPEKEPFSWDPFLQWLQSWYFGALPLVFLMCCILGWQKRISFSVKSPFSALLYCILWPINFFVRVRRRIIDIDAEARIRMSKESLFSKLSEKERQFLETYNSFAGSRNNSREKWLQEKSEAKHEVARSLLGLSRLSPRYVLAFGVVVLFRLVSFAEEKVPTLITQDCLQSGVEISLIQEQPPDTAQVLKDQLCQWVWSISPNENWEDSSILKKKKKTPTVKLSLLKGYIQEILKVPLGVNANLIKKCIHQIFKCNEKNVYGDVVCVRHSASFGANHKHPKF